MPTGAASKKRQTYIWIAVIILIFGVLTIPALIEKISEGTVVDTKRLSSAGATGAEVGYVYQDGIKRSVPDFRLIDQDSLPFVSDQMKGKVWVLDFFFTTCPTICPRMSRNLRTIQEEFGEEVGIISITINPRYDSPERLKDYASRYQAGPGWYFLGGEKDSIYELSRRGFYMLAEEGEEYPGGFEHSGLFALIDKEGYIRSRADEFGNPLIYYRGSILPEESPDENGEEEQVTLLIEDLRKLLEE